MSKDTQKQVVKEEQKEQIPAGNHKFRVGDTIRVYYTIKEGEKSRVQPFEGIVIAKKGKEKNKTFTVRRIAIGAIGVERIFPLYSPLINKVEIVKSAKVRRAKLYYLRSRLGKAAQKV